MKKLLLGLKNKESTQVAPIPELETAKTIGEESHSNSVSERTVNILRTKGVQENVIQQQPSQQQQQLQQQQRTTTPPPAPPQQNPLQVSGLVAGVQQLVRSELFKSTISNRNAEIHSLHQQINDVIGSLDDRISIIRQQQRENVLADSEKVIQRLSNEVNVLKRQMGDKAAKFAPERIYVQKLFECLQQFREECNRLQLRVMEQQKEALRVSKHVQKLLNENQNMLLELEDLRGRQPNGQRRCSRDDSFAAREKLRGSDDSSISIVEQFAINTELDLYVAQQPHFCKTTYQNFLKRLLKNAEGTPVRLSQLLHESDVFVTNLLRGAAQTYVSPKDHQPRNRSHNSLLQIQPSQASYQLSPQQQQQEQQSHLLPQAVAPALQASQQEEQLNTAAFSQQSIYYKILTDCIESVREGSPQLRQSILHERSAQDMSFEEKEKILDRLLGNRKVQLLLYKNIFPQVYQYYNFDGRLRQRLKGKATQPTTAGQRNSQQSNHKRYNSYQTEASVIINSSQNLSPPQNQGNKRIRRLQTQHNSNTISPSQFFLHQNFEHILQQNL